MARHKPGFVLRDSVRRSLMVATALQASVGAGSLHALPTGAQVVVPGSAQIGVPVNNALTVTNQPGAIINWQSFSIAPNELVKAPGGEILLAAGKSVTVTPLNASGVSFELQPPSDSLLNIGKLIADGGAIGAFAGTLRHSGEIRANAMVRDEAGRIVLQGASDTLIAAGSSTRADGRSGGSVRIESGAGTRVEGQVSALGSTGRGGRIEVLGERVVLAGSARVDASGASGGGTVLAGGDWQGANPEVRNAERSFAGAGVSLAADATLEGDGYRF